MIVNLRKVDVSEWIKDTQNIYIGRKTQLLPASKWQNPFPIRNNNREEVVKKFEQYLRNNRELLGELHHLKGKNLGCWCSPKLCHGSIIQKLIQENMDSVSTTNVTSHATFTTNVTFNTTANTIMSSQASGQYSPLPFGPSTRTRSSTGTQLKSAYMRLKVSPEKTLTPKVILGATTTTTTTTTSPVSNATSIIDSNEKGSPVASIPTSSSSTNATYVTSAIHQKTHDISDSGTTMAEVLNRVNELEYQLQVHSIYNLVQNDKIQNLERKVQSLEGQLMVVNARFSVRDHIIEALKSEVQRLQQYTRRYTVSVVGIEKKNNESPEDLREEVQKLVGEVDSSTTEMDIDKFHRNGRTYNNGKDQEILIRFKSHSAKEAFYRGRKTLPPARRGVKIRPSLSNNQRILLKEAEALVEDFKLNDETRNPVAFVFANIHGETQVKLKNKFRGNDLITFRSTKELVQIVAQAQAVKNTEELFHETYSWADKTDTHPEEDEDIVDDMGFDSL